MLQNPSFSEVVYWSPYLNHLYHSTPKYIVQHLLQLWPKCFHLPVACFYIKLYLLINIIPHQLGSSTLSFRQTAQYSTLTQLNPGVHLTMIRILDWSYCHFTQGNLWFTRIETSCCCNSMKICISSDTCTLLWENPYNESALVRHWLSPTVLYIN